MTHVCVCVCARAIFYLFVFNYLPWNCNWYLSYYCLNNIKKRKGKKIEQHGTNESLVEKYFYFLLPCSNLVVSIILIQRWKEKDSWALFKYWNTWRGKREERYFPRRRGWLLRWTFRTGPRNFLKTSRPYRFRLPSHAFLTFTKRFTFLFPSDRPLSNFLIPPRPEHASRIPPTRCKLKREGYFTRSSSSLFEIGRIFEREDSEEELETMEKERCYKASGRGEARSIANSVALVIRKSSSINMDTRSCEV